MSSQRKASRSRRWKHLEGFNKRRTLREWEVAPRAGEEQRQREGRWRRRTQCCPNPPFAQLLALLQAVPTGGPWGAP
jgi:hypothetical protein